MVQDINAKLNILRDILVKKKSSLAQILSITENQSEVLRCQEGNVEIQSMFSQMNIEKQSFIDSVINADNLFQSMFDEMADELTNTTTDYRESIILLQNLIREVTDIDVKIRVAEQKNKELILQKQNKDKREPNNQNNSGVKINVPKVSKNYLLKQYESNKNFD